jgi:hypothetical protein
MVPLPASSLQFCRSIVLATSIHRSSIHPFILSLSRRSSTITSMQVCLIFVPQDPLAPPLPLPNRFAPIAPKSAKLLEPGVERRRVEIGVALRDIGIDAVPRWS